MPRLEDNCRELSSPIFLHHHHSPDPALPTASKPPGCGTTVSVPLPNSDVPITLLHSMRSKQRASQGLPIFAQDLTRRRPSLYQRTLMWFARGSIQHWRLTLFILTLAVLEVYLHTEKFTIKRPSHNLDPPFHVGCQSPVLNTTERANAAFVMLARNSDREDAVSSIRSVQSQFNQHFGYPWVFLNDEAFDDDFVTEVRKTIAEEGGSSVDPVFEIIPEHMWSYPSWIDQDRAQRRMKVQALQGVLYADKESYHHMCRFNSGFFFDHPALSSYKWYWRVEPQITFTCAVTYDPFVEMERNDKRYGYTLALWELGRSIPSLFQKFSEFKQAQGIPTTSLWTAMMRPSWLPWPFRPLGALMSEHDSAGDMYNMCHFWSNFEIADMSLFRSQQYRDLFRYLDEEGGFYYERWGDAPVHSLAAALLLRPEQVHHFADFGYTHDPFQYCPYAPTEKELDKGILVPDMWARMNKEIQEGVEEEKLGCNCKCDRNLGLIKSTCMNRIRRTVM